MRQLYEVAGVQLYDRRMCGDLGTPNTSTQRQWRVTLGGTSSTAAMLSVESIVQDPTSTTAPPAMIA